MMHKDDYFFSNTINDIIRYDKINCSSEVSPEKNSTRRDSKVINTNIKTVE